MTEFNYLTADQGYKTIFLQLPKPFITSPKYKTLSSDAKIAYTLLRDRAEYSLMNNLVDEKNRIYFLFTDEDLANDLSVSRNTARKVKQELIQVNLLKKVDMGYNKREHKRNASRHYLAELGFCCKVLNLLSNKVE
ncbi:MULTISPECIES: replication initiator protein A [Enterococcus]|uniref:replication initiator protein A n=1 Tax=Enterococcus TaxID=1350 RepID=UPI0021E85845|nr:replication initiator protein A [Enterococcus hirae]MCV3097179.1 replication initiator protein A [Enterococcus hirae]MCV3104842.1 replication initiator protein A [Enterococcus hirae]MCV3109788.1 replication initiator protein A [Enterococcus hirae]MCV3124779.1 replication initiator protein A [Enterococcus hirae]MCV3129787.1 replication initiator protein A [Enterococcus hirae]